MLERLLRNPVAVVLVVALAIVGGIAGLRTLPVDLFPRLDYPLINIVTHYPAGTAEDMELLVTRPIENAMLGLNDLRRLRSVSSPGFSQVTVELTWGVDVLQARQLIASRLSTASLPAGASSELENLGTSLAMLSTYTLVGGDPVALRSWAQYRLAPRLAALPGVARIQVMGGAETAWRIDVEPLALLRHSVTLGAIASAIESANVLDTGGFLERYGRELLVRTDARLLDLDDLGQVVVATGPDSRPVRLADVATIYRGAKPQRYVVTADRLPAVALTVQKQPAASTVTVSRAVDRELGQVVLPRGARLEKFYDQAEIIGVAYRGMRTDLVTGALLAIVAVVWVLGRNRASAVVAIGFPLVVLTTFAAMGFLDLGLNLMTIGALTVALGMIDDDAVVVLENIERHRGLGKPIREAAVDGTREVLSADVAGTLTVMAAFVPVLFVGGLAGRMFRPFGITFVLVLGFSLLVSLTLIPLAAVYWSASRRPYRENRTAGARWVRWLGVQNLRLLDAFLAHRLATVVGVLLLFGASITLLALNPARLLPLLDEDSLLLSYQLAPGTSLAESDRVGDDLERRLLSMSQVEAVFRRTGSPEASFYIEGPDEGELVVRLNRSGARNALAVRDQIDAMLGAVPGVIGRVNEPTTEKLDESLSGLPALFGISLFGDDLEGLYAAARRVEAAASNVRGLSNVVNNTKVMTDQVRVRVDRSALARLDVDPATLATTVRIALQGDVVTQVVVDQRPIDLFVRYSGPLRDELEDLRKLRVPSRRGAPVPLSMLASIEEEAGFPKIEHQHGVRSLTLTAEIDGNPVGVLSRLRDALNGLELPTGIEWRFSGEYAELASTGGQLVWVLLAAALLVFGVIATQLGSALDAGVVLFKLPLDFMGGAMALFLTRQHLDLTVAIGFVTLIGVATNNGIMLLTFTRRLRLDGMDAVAAVREAVRLRTRPMLVTHLTTLLALIPASLGLGAGPALLRPLGVMLLGGLTAGTLLTLNVLPVIYVTTERWRRTIEPVVS